MKWILLALCLLVAAVACTVAARAIRRGVAGRFPGRDSASPTGRARCLRCHGTGWLGGEPERTFTFTGDGFEDRHPPATPCPDCHGTGVARR